MNIYLDCNSTTPVDSQVLDEMLPYFSNEFGNAASKTHAYGWKASAAVELARERVANFLNVSAHEIIFTSGSTESVNLSIKGVAEAYTLKGKHIVTISTEHKCVLDTCAHLEKLGYEITYLPVLSDGTLDLDVLRKSIRDDTVLVSVMLANNETGVIHPVSEISKIVHEKKSILLTDATQAAGKIQIDVADLGADLLCISAHKFYGPKGIGALYVKRKNPRVSLVAQTNGGGHERGWRSGTLNVPGIVGLGKACELAMHNQWEESARISILRSKLEQALTENDKAMVNGNIRSRLPNTTNICFRGLRAEALIKQFPELAVATGSACSSALPEPSHVLIAMGMTEEDAFSSVRFSLGKFNTAEEIDFVIGRFGSLE